MKWQDILPQETIDLGNRLADRAMEERKTKKICPAQENIFRALQLTPPDKVKVVILGQDPYHTGDQATGLAFSVPAGAPPQPSLQNIMKELCADVGGPEGTIDDLTSWAEQGVLLLNTSLTVETGKANSHADWGWQDFTKQIIKACVNLPQPIVFICWGTPARKFIEEFNVAKQPRKSAIWSTHPSPFSAYSGTAAAQAFMGSKPFSKANTMLKFMGGTPIDWRTVLK